MLGAAIALSGLAVVGAVTDLIWDERLGIFEGRVGRVMSRVSVLTLALCAAWLSDAWVRRTKDQHE